MLKGVVAGQNRQQRRKMKTELQSMPGASSLLSKAMEKSDDSSPANSSVAKDTRSDSVATLSRSQKKNKRRRQKNL
jgi:hypothetical protein